ncbi:MAG: hypothetical protein P4M02_03745 [Clostridia bacterium]|nr:hypothetical protein [Clostridia bacterium]
MADSKASPAVNSGHQTFKEAVCIDAKRVYDSCSDKDCLEDLRVYFNDEDQTIINNSVAVKSRGAELFNVFIDVEPIQFNRGFYAVDITFCFHVVLEAYETPCGKAHVVCGVASFNKKVILYGSEGNVKIFSSEFVNNADDEQDNSATNLPKAVVEAVDPITLAAKLIDCECPTEGCQLPRAFTNKLTGSVGLVVPIKTAHVTLGLFSIVKIERNVQMLIPAYDFCIPDKECTSSTGDPCELFKSLKFPTNEFYPPRFCDLDDTSPAGNCNCGDRR